jgi:hypothetical protein
LFTTVDTAITEALRPKRPGAFAYLFRADGTIKADGSATAGPSEKNAVLRHELRQEGFGSAGISTTPILERARFYALAGGKNDRGLVITIDRALLHGHGVREFVVAAWVPDPSCPEDEEVILVAADGGLLPQQIVIDTAQVVAEQPA